MGDYGWLVGLTALAMTVAGFVAAWAIRISKGELAAKEVDELRAEIHAVRTDLANFQTRVAREYVTAAAISQVETRLTQAIDRLGDRLDRLFEQRPSARRATSGN